MLSLWGVSRESGKVYDGLDMLWNKAKAAKTRADLLVVRHQRAGSERFAGEIASVPLIIAGDGANQDPTHG